MTSIGGRDPREACSRPLSREPAHTPDHTRGPPLGVPRERGAARFCAPHPRLRSAKRPPHSTSRPPWQRDRVARRWAPGPPAARANARHGPPVRCRLDSSPRIARGVAPGRPRRAPHLRRRRRGRHGGRSSATGHGRGAGGGREGRRGGGRGESARCLFWADRNKRSSLRYAFVPARAAGGCAGGSPRQSRRAAHAPHGLRGEGLSAPGPATRGVYVG